MGPLFVYWINLFIESSPFTEGYNGNGHGFILNFNQRANIEGWTKQAYNRGNFFFIKYILIRNSWNSEIIRDNHCIIITRMPKKIKLIPMQMESNQFKPTLRSAIGTNIGQIPFPVFIGIQISSQLLLSPFIGDSYFLSLNLFIILFLFRMTRGDR